MRLIITREGLIARCIGEYADRLGKMSNRRLFNTYCKLFDRLHADEVAFVYNEKMGKKAVFHA